ncbi:hypothetical protein W911_01625 [Hyphomicrobium nitrativorans NL23]|uniref:Uncharacterized protein n=1 Tax=Hyphomicrobium nitrativorans NL23 TaxID=1029756 RepID=V5SG50_9HYPH|nr:hypothetical protein W911_01625 [Hyphomicrobium nitrativorans NL23]
MDQQVNIVAFLQPADMSAAEIDRCFATRVSQDGEFIRQMMAVMGKMLCSGVGALAAELPHDRRQESLIPQPSIVRLLKVAERMV